MAWFMMGWFGRRTLYLGGQIGMVLLLSIVGFLGIAPPSNNGAEW